MQEMRAPGGDIHREFVAGKSKDVQQHLDARREELERQGYTFVGRRKVRPNEGCPCSSGRKFKHCCISNVVRAAGGTFMKPGAAPDTRRKL